VDDPQRQPKDSDRSQLAGRIKRASDEGRISGADRDIRLGNVWTATSMSELDLMTRELDQLEATPLPTPAAPEDKPWSKFEPGKGDGSDAGVGATSTTTASRAAAISVGIAVVVLVAAVGLFFLSRGGSDENAAADPGGQAQPGGDSTAAQGGKAPKYALTGPGVRGFLQTYQKRFGTSRVVDLTLFEDYAVIQVPVPGKARQAGWIYRDASGFSNFGGVRAMLPGTQVIDTAQLAIPALMRNIAGARKTLNVEEPAKAYVIIRSNAGLDAGPRANVYLTNNFQESGYLATTLDGKVQQTHAYQAPPVPE
jgi:hypothetical protein